MSEDGNASGGLLDPDRREVLRAAGSDHMSPAYPRSMHICFYIRDDVDFDKFIHDLEAESARRGMTQLKANRVITVTTEQQRQAAPMDANTNKITEGPSNGWSLMYCKGPDGEQLEFVQALNPVKKKFTATGWKYEPTASLKSRTTCHGLVGNWRASSSSVR